VNITIINKQVKGLDSIFVFLKVYAKYFNVMSLSRESSLHY